jgi:hypothetical protein
MSVQSSGPQSRLRFGALNLALMGGAGAALVAGYALLARGSTTAAPVLLVLGYCVLLPLGLILKGAPGE